MNALGNNVGPYKPLVFNPVPKDGLSPFDMPTAFNLVDTGGCVVDGIEQDCSMHSNSSATMCPHNYCGPQRALKDGKFLSLTFGFQSDAQGNGGYAIPTASVSSRNRNDVYSEDGKTLETKGEWENDGQVFVSEPNLGTTRFSSVVYRTPSSTQGDPGKTAAVQSDPCAGNKGTIDPNAGNSGAGIDHLSERHIDPQAPTYAPGGRIPKSYFEFGMFFTKGKPSATKTQREKIVMGMMQAAFEYGAPNIIATDVYAYSYAPYLTLPFGMLSIDFVGRDAGRDYNTTNVRTVVLNVSDCQPPKLITGYPGIPNYRDGRAVNINGIPRWSDSWTLPFYE